MEIQFIIDSTLVANFDQSKALKEAGIVIENSNYEVWKFNQPKGKAKLKNSAIIFNLAKNHDSFLKGMEGEAPLPEYECYPAPSVTELWNGVPPIVVDPVGGVMYIFRFGHGKHGSKSFAFLRAIRSFDKDQDGHFAAGDDLVDLLINVLIKLKTEEYIIPEV